MASTRRSPADFTDRQWADRWVHRAKFEYIIRTNARVFQGRLLAVSENTVVLSGRQINRKAIDHITAIPRTITQPLH